MTKYTPKYTYRFPLNLQLFAEDPNDDLEVEIDDEDDSIEFELEDDSDVDADDEEIELQDADEDQGAEGDEGEESGADDQDAGSEDDGQQQVKSDKGKGKNETAAAVIAERKKWQAKLKLLEGKSKAAERMMAQLEVTELDDLNRRMDAFEADKLTKQGVSPELAARIATSERELKEQREDLRKQKFTVEASQLKTDPFYADLGDYQEELEELAQKNGTTLKAAYLSVHGERRMKEREAEIEARVKGNKQKREAKKVDTSPTGSNSSKNKRRVNLSADERAIAKAAGMTPEEYAKFKKR